MWDSAISSKEEFCLDERGSCTSRGGTKEEKERGTTYGKMKKSAVEMSRTIHANVAGRGLVFTSHFGILHAPLFRWHTISANHWRTRFLLAGNMAASIASSTHLRHVRQWIAARTAAHSSCRSSVRNATPITDEGTLVPVTRVSSRRETSAFYQYLTVSSRTGMRATRSYEHTTSMTYIHI